MNSPAAHRKIALLPPEIAERIAAGEVIERPASVVKELVENAIDAGATQVWVTLVDGGRSMIEVLDNGCGISSADLEIALLRHATSKLRGLEDLEKILTLGFRGEALASIAAVGGLEMISRTQDASASAFELNPEISGLKPQAVTFGQFVDSDSGTRVRVHSLFSQVPARLKFLKSPGAEASAVREWMEKLSLSHAEVGFSLTHNDRKVFAYKSESREDRIKRVLGADDHDSIRVEALEENDLKLKAYWLDGLSLTTTRHLVQVVNGRVLRDRLLQQALLNPFRQSFLPGKFPAIALYLDLPPDWVDVNVHPTKTEVRFLNTGAIYKAVHHLVDRMLHQKRHQPHSAPLTLPEAFVSKAEVPDYPSKSWSREQSESQISLSLNTSSPSRLSSTAFADTERPHILDHARYVGSLFQTYLVFEKDQNVILVDQHAAHERIRYERLKKQALDERNIPSQSLLIPEPIPFPEERRIEVEGRLSLLTQLGFDVEFFNEHTLLFRSVPAVWTGSGLKARLVSLVDHLLHLEIQDSQLLLDEKLFEKLASESCHSAVRAGDSLEPEEALALARDLFHCEHPWNCPHGRPTIVQHTKGRFEEWFQRRI